MTMSAEFAQLARRSAPGNLVELFDLDLTPLDPLAGVLHFIPGTDEGRALGKALWLGNEYTPFPIEVTGCDVVGKGTLPRPTLKVANVLGTVTSLIRLYGTVAGAVLTRWQVFRQHLDDGATPTANGHLPVDVYELDRVVTRDRMSVEIECLSALDFHGKKLPARTVMRNICSLVYRKVNADGTFDYATATCPYVGTATFDRQGNPCAPASDQCSKQLGTGCKVRFVNTQVPFGGFPGVGRFN
jgi:lambda family phage minor tail protein L